MAKFHVVGADRDSGEDLELTVEAPTAEEARSKASRRGVLVAECRVVSGVQRAHATAEPTRRRPLVTATVIAVIIASTIGIVYFFWLRPANKEINRTLADVSAPNEKTKSQKGKAAGAAVTTPPQRAQVAAPQTPVVRVVDERLLMYVQSCEPFVREIKALRARVGEGTSYKDFHDKVIAVSDEYAQVGAPPDDADAIGFSESSAAAMERYKQADRRWLLAIRNNLYIAEKYPIQEMLQAADADVERLDSQFSRVKSKSR